MQRVGIFPAILYDDCCPILELARSWCYHTGHFTQGAFAQLVWCANSMIKCVATKALVVLAGIKFV